MIGRIERLEERLVVLETRSQGYTVISSTHSHAAPLAGGSSVSSNGDYMAWEIPKVPDFVVRLCAKPFRRAIGFP